MTTNDVLNWVNGGWKNSPYARQRTYGYGIDVDGLFGFQCKDLANAYGAFLGHPFTAGNANALWDWPQDPFYQKIPNTQLPRPGDVFVSDYFGPDGVRYDHTGIVVDNISPTGFRSLDQNWFNSNLDYGSPPAFVNHGYSKIRGYLRPQLGGNMTISTRGDVESWYRELLGRDVDEAGYAAYVGKEYKWGYEQIVSSPEYQARKQRIAALQQERDTLYSIAEIRRQMLEADAGAKAELEKELELKRTELAQQQAKITELDSQIQEITKDAVVVTRTGWSKLFDVVANFFRNLMG